MARICGFHPQDPGSIPGVEVCPRMTLKAFYNVCIQEVQGLGHIEPIFAGSNPASRKCPGEGTLRCAF